MKVVIFGASGHVGTALAEILASDQQAKWDVAAVTRSMTGTGAKKLAALNVNVVEGDPFDKQSVLALTSDVDVIASCIGFVQYSVKYWAKHWPLTVDNLLAGTMQPGKRRKLIFCDNLYAYGWDGVVSPTKQAVPPSLKSKPGIRAQLRQTFQNHMQQHPGTLTVVGAAEFYGPGVTQSSFLGDSVTGKITTGGNPMALYAVNHVHDFCYVPDFAKALAVACADERALDHFWIAPHSIHGKTMQQIGNDIAAKATKGKAPVKPFVLTTFWLYLLSPFMSFASEMIEMKGFWVKDYVVDDSDFVKTFGMQATPYDESLQALVTYYETNA